MAVDLTGIYFYYVGTIVLLHYLQDGGQQYKKKSIKQQNKEKSFKKGTPWVWKVMSPRNNQFIWGKKQSIVLYWCNFCRFHGSVGNQYRRNIPKSIPLYAVCYITAWHEVLKWLLLFGLSNGKDGGREAGPGPPVTLSTAVKLFLSARLCSAIWSHITDCDETFNYWEPVRL